MASPATIWSLVALANLTITATFVFALYPLLGIDSFPAKHPFVMIALEVVVPPIAPLEGLLGINLYFLYLAATTVAVESIAKKVALAGICYSLFGALVALNLAVASKWMPLPLKRVCSSGSRMVYKFHHTVAAPLPISVQYAIGVPFTLLTEVFIIPCAVCILFIFAKLKIAGEDFDLKPEKPGKPEKEGQTLMVMIHGNRFNECQWLFGRILMHSAFPDVEFMTVNYFSGPWKRDYCSRSVTIEGCSEIAMEQIKAQVDQRNLKPSRVVLMGHSLGGLVSAYIAENLAEKNGLPVTNVVAWSAPLAGSDLLLWAKSKPRLVKSGIVPQKGMEIEFCPTNPKLHTLQTSLSKSVKSSRINYFAVTGGCDPLVRPPSALLPNCFKKENTHFVPYLGHYNIKVSSHVWHIVIDHLEEEKLGKSKAQ